MSTFDTFSYPFFMIISHFHKHYIKYTVWTASFNNPMINKFKAAYKYNLMLYSARNAWRGLGPFSTQKAVLTFRFTHDNMESHFCVA
jgi:hypothetical protein